MKNMSSGITTVKARNQWVCLTSLTEHRAKHWEEEGDPTSQLLCLCAFS